MPDNLNVSMIGDSVVAAIKDSVETKVIEVDGLNFVTRPIHRPPAELRPDTLIVHTLSGLVDYVSNVARIDPDVAHAIKCVHVVSHDRVDVCGALVGRDNQRYVYLSRSTCRSM